jgi:hypothetical protein
MATALQAVTLDPWTHGITDMENYRHLVEIDKGRLVIHRVFDNGSKELFTETMLPDINAVDNWAAFEEFAKQLGENILMDSPESRKKFHL